MQNDLDQQLADVQKQRESVLQQAS
jgi:hypothetical protein